MATVRCRHMVRYICRVLCTVHLMHVICTGASCRSSCIRRVHVRSMQWTPLLVQSKRVSTPNEMLATPKVQVIGRTETGTRACDHTYNNTLLGMPRVAHVAVMPLWLVCLAPLSENHVRTTLSKLNWLNTFCCT